MTNPYQALVLSEPSLLAYWQLDEVSGTVAADSKGSLTGTYQAGVTLDQPGVLGSPCPSFNGTTASGYMGTAAPPAGLPAGAAPRTLECWVNTAAAQASGNGFVGIAGYGTAAALQLFSLYCKTDNKTILVGDAQNTCTFTLGRAFNDGLWHHIAATYDGTRLTLYFDGSAVASSTPAENTVLGTNPFWVGRVVGGDGAWNGLLDEAAVYNAALPADSVADHYYACGLSPDQRKFYRTARPRPRTASPAPGWKRGLVVALPLQNEDGSAAGVLDAVTGRVRAFVGAPGWANGRWGPEIRIDDTRQGGVGVGSPLLGLTEFTVAALCTASLATGGAAGLRQLWCEDTATANIRLAFSTGLFVFQLGSDGAYPNLTAAPQVLNEPVLVTARLTTAGVRSIWYGQYKQAERTDAGIAYPGTGGTLVLGTGATFLPRNWAGGISAAYVWARALSDAEIVALAADPFAPVRPAPARLGVLAPPSPTFDPLPWLRRAATAPRAARLAPPAASGWAPRLTPAADLLPWLRRAAAPAPPATAPRALLAPWTPASAPAPDPLAWLLRGVPSPPPEAAPLTTLRAGWRPEIGAGPAPPVRHALVRFWRGPEARMPRLEDGEPAWATDTKSLWMGSASGNVRIGP